MQRNSSITIITAIIVALGLFAYFAGPPIVQRINLGLDLRGGLRVVLEAEEQEGEKITQDTITKAVGILRNRVDSLGVKETALYPQGDKRVVIEIAGEKDPEAAVDILKNTADIKFHIMDEGQTRKSVLIVPAYMAKGLEFDAVLVYDVSKINYNSQLDRKLLYIACTRALHRLSLYYVGEKNSFL